jgi:hypothetical protein
LMADQKKAFQGALADTKAKHQAKFASCKHSKSATDKQCDACTVGSAPVTYAVETNAPVVPSSQAVSMDNPPVASPQSGVAGWPVVPSVQALMNAGRCGGCYGPGSKNACPPRGATGQWIIPTCPTHASAQQLSASGQHAGQDCPPQQKNPACCGIPSFYCPPVVAPPIPAKILQSGGKVFAMRPTRLPAIPSNQNLPSSQSSGSDRFSDLTIPGDE